MTGPERKIESYLIAQVKKRNGWCLKLAPLVKGNPDRLVLLPGRPPYLVETKSARGVLSPAQKVWHARARARGHTVYVLASRDAVDRWMAYVDKKSNLLV